MHGMLFVKKYNTNMFLESDRIILQQLRDELKLIDQEKFKNVHVHESTNTVKHDEYYALWIDKLIFRMEGLNLILWCERYVGCTLRTNGGGYILGEPDVKKILIACDIYYNQGRGKYGEQGRKLNELLDEHKKCNHTKSARKI